MTWPIFSAVSAKSRTDLLTGGVGLFDGFLRDVGRFQKPDGRLILADRGGQLFGRCCYRLHVGRVRPAAAATVPVSLFVSCEVLASVSAAPFISLAERETSSTTALTVVSNLSQGQHFIAALLDRADY